MKSPTQSLTQALPQGEGAAYSNLYDSSFKEERSLYNVCVLKRPAEKVFSATSSPWGRAGVGLLSLLLCGCVTDFEPKDIDEVSSILVVEGIVTDDITNITLSRSENLLNDNASDTYYVDNAKVYVECDDGTQFHADSWDWGMSREGKYTIQTGKLNPDRKYCLKIEVEELDTDVTFIKSRSLPTKTYEYHSDYSYPIQTPEIDSVFCLKRGKGQPVMIFVATHSPYNEIMYYRWSYKEDWEYYSEFVYYDEEKCPKCNFEPLKNGQVCPRCGNEKKEIPYYCWDKSKSTALLLGSAEKTVFGKLTDKIVEYPPTSRRISYLYRIDVKQNAISKRAYDYFNNIRRNSENTGSLFAPVPSELRGNIVCETDPGRPVIGYIDISTTTQKRKYISGKNIYEHPYSDCKVLTIEDIVELVGEQYLPLPGEYIIYHWYPMAPPEFLKLKCVDCTYYGGKTDKPEDWPNEH